MAHKSGRLSISVGKQQICLQMELQSLYTFEKSRAITILLLFIVVYNYAHDRHITFSTHSSKTNDNIAPWR